MNVKRPMIIALIAYVLTECMAWAGCSINDYIIGYTVCILVLMFIGRMRKKAEHYDVSAFFYTLFVYVFVFLIGILGMFVMNRGIEIRKDINEKYSSARNEGNFDERNYYLGIQTIFCSVDSSGESANSNSGNIFNIYINKLSLIKNRIGKELDSRLDGRTASVYKAFLIGDKKSITEDDKVSFRMAGIAHIFAISGLHISILGIGLYKLLRKKFMMLFSVAVSSILITNYALMIGISVSTTRAIVMFILRMIAEVIGRKYDEINGFIISMIIVCSIYPWGFTSFSFQMSYTAVFTCYFIIPGVIDYLKINSRLLSTFVSSMVLNAVLSILVSFYYYEIYPYTVLTNMIILPFVGMVIVFGFLGCYEVGALFIKLGLNICDYISGLMGSCIICGRLEMWQYIIILMMISVYIIHITFVRRKEYYYKVKTKDFNDYKDERNTCIKKYVLLISTYACILIIIVYGRYILDEFNSIIGIDDGTEITMVDIGQGDFLHINTVDGLNVTIDGGSSDIKDVAKNRMVPYLKYKGVGVIDYAFISHSDDDHCNGLMDIIMNYDLYRIRVRNIVVAKLENRDEALSNIIEVAKLNGVNVIEIQAGDKILDFICLMPYETITYDDCNEASLVLSYEVKSEGNKNFTMLLTGDYNGDENDLIDNIRKYTDVDGYTILKVAHHGSKFSTYESILKEVNPEYAWISCGVNNRYGHPSKELIDRIYKCTEADIYVTKFEGEVKFLYFDGKNGKLMHK